MSSDVHSREATLNRRRAARVAQKRRGRTLSAIALVLAGLLAVGGTVAFLIDSSNEVKNTFTPATVKTDIIESFDGTTKSNVTIKNLETPSTNIPAFIRAKVVVNWVKVDSNGNVTNVYGTAPVMGTDYTNWTTSVASGWKKQGDYYYWTSPVNPGASTGVLISQIKALTSPPAGYALNVQILSEAVQAAGATATSTPAVMDAWGIGVKSDGTLNVAG